MVDLDDFEPVQISAEPAPEPERFVIFRIGDEEFTAPKRVPPRVALAAIRVARRSGWAEGLWFMVEQSIGEEAVNRLMESSATSEQVAAVFSKLRELYFGQTEAMTGKPS